MSLDGGRLFFGEQARLRPHATIVSELKTRLIHETDGAHQNLLNGVEGSTVEASTALYLAWILSVTRRKIADQQHTDRFDWRLNIAAPMTQFEDPELKSRYQRILQAAWGLAFEDGRQDDLQGGPANDLLRRANALLVGVDVRPEDQVPYAVLPETLAPLVSLANDPRFLEGRYLVFDLGAGTTEQSVNFFPNPAEGFPISVYADQSIYLGTNALLEPGDVDLQKLKELVWQARVTWYHGYKLQKEDWFLRQAWKTLHVLLTGGGSQIPMVRQELESAKSTILYPFNGDPGLCYQVGDYRPADIDYGPQGKLLEDHAYLLSVAHGLSVERQRWPEFVQPKNHRPIRPRPLTARDVDAWRDV
jgi:hypothetical protein